MFRKAKLGDVIEIYLLNGKKYKGYLDEVDSNSIAVKPLGKPLDLNDRHDIVYFNLHHVVSVSFQKY